MCRNNNNMSSEELRIRGELEKDIERELEEEIKEGICRLAVKLHRLYYYQQQQQKEQKKKMERENMFSQEVSINMISKEGATRIEIKEMKKNIQEKTHGLRRRVVHDQKKQQGGKVINIASKSKKFDWPNSLRSAAATNINIHGSRGCKTRINIASSSSSLKKQQQHTVNKADKIMQLELGWKD